MALQQCSQSTTSWTVNGSFEGTWDVFACDSLKQLAESRFSIIILPNNFGKTLQVNR